MKKKAKNFIFIDLFAGIGGFRSALESFGGNCAFTSEWDKIASFVYEENFGEKPAGDITRIHASNIPKHDVLCAGFPCQAFSVSGKQKGFEDTRGTLFFDIARIADYHKPKILFIENVKNLVKHDEGRTIKRMSTILNEIGYNVFYAVLNASYYGVPQARKRVYFVCFNNDLAINSFSFPDRANKHVILKDVTESDSKTKGFIINRKDIRLNKKAKLQNKMYGSCPLKPIRVGTINNGGQGERIYSEYGHAITLSAYGGGAAAKTGAYLINNKIRQLSPRECLRVLGFPESFEMPVAVKQAYKLCGNSVVVPVLKEIFKKIMEKGVL